MADTWDDSDDDWDKSDDDELAAKLSKLQTNVPTFDDEEDLALKEKVEQDRMQTVDLKIRGKALAEKKQKEQDAKEELELARRAMELEAEAEAKMTPDERRQLERQRIEAADNELTDDLFGADNTKDKTTAASAADGDDVVLKDLKDHLKHARKVADAMKKHGNVHFASAFFKECLSSSKDVLDDDAVTEIIKTLNVIKNEKVQAAKRKVKGQAQKSKKVDKVAEAKARQKMVETFGDNDKFDQYDVYGEKYEDDFF